MWLHKVLLFYLYFNLIISDQYKIHLGFIAEHREQLQAQVKVLTTDNTAMKKELQSLSLKLQGQQGELKLLRTAHKDLRQMVVELQRASRSPAPRLPAASPPVSYLSPAVRAAETPLATGTELAELKSMFSGFMQSQQVLMSGVSEIVGRSQRPLFHDTTPAPQVH